MRTEWRTSARCGATLAEVLVAIGIVGLLTAVLLPAVQSSRETARQAECRDRLRGIAMAAHAYESVHGTFPPTSTNYVDMSQTMHHPVSPHRHLLSYLDDVLGSQIDSDDQTPALASPDERPLLNSLQNRSLLEIYVRAWVCPSDDAPAGGTNYRANLGPSVHIVRRSRQEANDETVQSGAFVCGRAVRPAEFRDGLSNTAFFSERVVGDGTPGRYSPFSDLYSPPVGFLLTIGPVVEACQRYATWNPPASYSFMGHNWLIGGFLHTWYNHTVPPNSRIPDCARGEGVLVTTDGGPGLYTARSYHPGGVHVAYADGSVRFVAESIDLDAWRAAGTRNRGD